MYIHFLEFGFTHLIKMNCYVNINANFVSTSFCTLKNNNNGNNNQNTNNNTNETTPSKGKHSTNRPLCKLQVSSQGSGDNPRLSLFPVHCTDHGFLHLLQMLSVINKKKKGWQISVIM